VTATDSSESWSLSGSESSLGRRGSFVSDGTRMALNRSLAEEHRLAGAPSKTQTPTHSWRGYLSHRSAN
jgi:hypothetical protein